MYAASLGDPVERRRSGDRVVSFRTENARAAPSRGSLGYPSAPSRFVSAPGAPPPPAAPAAPSGNHFASGSRVTFAGEPSNPLSSSSSHASFASGLPPAVFTTSGYGDRGGGTSGTSVLGDGGGPGHGGVCYLLSLQFMGLAGLPAAGWLERPPVYELIVHAGGSARRLRPRIPPPPASTAAGLVREGGSSGSSGGAPVDLEALVPEAWRSPLLRLDERLSFRLQEPVNLFTVDVWEERQGLFDFASKAPARKLLGQCVVPLDAKFNRRPCSWMIATRGEAVAGDGSTVDVGCLTVKFGLVSSPGQVRDLRILEYMVTSSEVHVAWDPPLSDGAAVPLRGYRISATELYARNDQWLALDRGGAFDSADVDGAPRTASAPVSSAPRAVLRGLRGNTSYKFKVWPVGEAGPGPAAEVIGRTSAVAPGACGLPQYASGFDTEATEFSIQWTPPDDTGGAPVVAYRVWLRLLFLNHMGDVVPAEGWIDMGLFEHQGGPADLQSAPVRRDTFPSCEGCLCSVAAINAAGHTGVSTPEVPILSVQPRRPSVDIQELSMVEREDGDQGASSMWHESEPAVAGNGYSSSGEARPPWSQGHDRPGARGGWEAAASSSSTPASPYLDARVGALVGGVGAHGRGNAAGDRIPDEPVANTVAAPHVRLREFHARHGQVYRLDASSERGGSLSVGVSGGNSAARWAQGARGALVAGRAQAS
eukprot:TRINITY_DN23768_c0_g1_i1.p1 TRINITY_DN23768_c0_g1~~TRINITY_DN23768_c0_g1_i1.p1  ORF type:complete len:708 (+),score=134.14 TRINITY_DN23768_c0_g1_i1:198-2321(+)